MANDTNQVILIGRLTSDCTMKYTSGGMAIANMSLAVGRKVKKGESWVDETSFFDVVLFGKQAEAVNQYLLKGTQICVNGELHQDRWEKDGQKRSAVKINANNIQLLGRPAGQQGQAPAQGQGKPQSRLAPQPQGVADHDFEDDVWGDKIPF